LYLAAALSAWTTANYAGFPENKLWRVISIGFIGLGINKQLDLQTAFTELGRVLASMQGWYEQRRTWFIVAVAAICLLMAVVFLVLARRAPMPTWLALVGVVIVLGFVTIRAASFHHFDHFIGSRAVGLKWN
jgi:high-affinity Fe2+/Pb2+ permease